MQLLLRFWMVLVCVAIANKPFGQAESRVKVLEASSCEDLRDILENEPMERRIIVNKNMRCNRENWRAPVYVTNHTVIEGSKFGKGVPAIDWADSTNALVVQQHASLTFRSIVLMQDFLQLGGLKLSFATGFDGSSVRMMGVGVGIRSCQQTLSSLIPIFRELPRPDDVPGNQEIIERDSPSVIYVESVAFVPSNRDNSSWTVCKAVYHCNVNNPFQEDFQRVLKHEHLDSNCAATSRPVVAMPVDGREGSSGGSSNGSFLVIVALFAALCTTLILIVIFAVFKLVIIPLTRKQKNLKKGDEENPTTSNTAVSSKRSVSRSRHNSSVSLLNTSVQLTNIELGVPLGKGIMSIVYKGYHNDRPLAVKIIDMEAAESVVRDDDPIGLYLARHLHHANVVDTVLYQTHRMEEFNPSPSGLDATMTTGGSFAETPLSSINEILPVEVFQYRTFHVMEFCNLGTLQKAMADGMFRTPDDQPRMVALLRSALDIARGMHYLHSAKIIHGQLRPSNVLLKGDANDARGFVCKVADFGLTHLLERQQALELAQGRNLMYRAPETFRKCASETGSDVFSFGMILWYMLSNATAFSETDPAETISNILDGMRPEIPPIAPRKYERLIRDCWHEDTSARPPFANIIERLSKIITEVVQASDSNNSTPKHRRYQRSLFSSTDVDTVIQGSGSVTGENMFDTVEIHDGNSLNSGSVSTTGSVPFWEQFQNTATSPMSTKSDIVFPSFDLITENRPPKRSCTSLDMTSTDEISPDDLVELEQQNAGTVVSKPSETVSLRYGIASDSIGSDLDDLSPDL